MPTQRELWQHVTKDILEFEEDEINDLARKGMRKINFLRKNTRRDIIATYQAHQPADGFLLDMLNFHEYLVVMKPTDDDIMALDSDVYNNLDSFDIKRRYDTQTTLSTSAPPIGITPSSTSAPAPVNTVDYALVDPTNIRTTDFIRYTSFSLSCTDDIMKFYSNVCTQGHQYMIYLKPIDTIDATTGIIPRGLPPEAATIISSTLYSKFQREFVIDSNYSIGQNLLKTTTNDYEFLTQLLMIVHPKFVDTTSQPAAIASIAAIQLVSGQILG